MIGGGSIVEPLSEETMDTTKTVRQAVWRLRRGLPVKEPIGDMVAEAVGSVIKDPAVSAAVLRKCGWNLTPKRRAATAPLPAALDRR